MLPELHPTLVGLWRVMQTQLSDACVCSSHGHAGGVGVSSGRDLGLWLPPGGIWDPGANEFITMRPMQWFSTLGVR